MTKFPFPPNKQTNQTGDNMMNSNRSGMSSMFNSNKLFDRFFRKADGVVWDMMTGNIGIQTDDGIATMSGEGDDAQITLNLFDDFGFALPAFAQSTPVANVNVGDIIYRGAKNTVAWVIEKNVDTGKFKLMKTNGETVGWTAPKVTMLGFDSGVMVLRSLTSMLPNGNKDLGNMQNMLMPMLLCGDMLGSSGGNDMMDTMMPFMLMQMMNGNSDSGNMMFPMMMAQMMKGGK